MKNHPEEMALKTLGVRIKKKVGALELTKIYRLQSGSYNKRDLAEVCNEVTGDAEESGLLGDTGGHFLGRRDWSMVSGATDRSSQVTAKS